MPRDASGLYSLPSGNPVITNTVISSVWANTTLADIAAQLNNVFTRDGLLGPTGPFKVIDGTVAAPGLAFNSEPGLGWYRPSAGVMALAAGGAAAIQIQISAGSRGINLLAGPGADSWAGVVLQSKGTGQNTITGQQNGVTHWTVVPGVGGAGDNFAIGRYNDAGNWVEDAFSITRGNGDAFLARALVVGTEVVTGGTNGAGAYRINNSGAIRCLDMGIGTLSGFGDSVGLNNPTATGGLYFGVNGNSKIWIEQARNVISNNRIDIGTPDLRIMGIATTGSSPNLFQDPSQGYVYRFSSSRRYKKDIEDAGDTSWVYDLRPVEYTSTSIGDADKGRMLGLIAEEVYEHNTQVVSMIDIDGQRVPDGVGYERLVVPLIAELKKLRERVAQLEAV